MKKYNFVDEVEIEVQAGSGGDGRVSFKREKFLPKGGPDGGDGGDGGSVYFVANHNMSSLMDFKSKYEYVAESGEMGGKNKMTGKSGEDLFIQVPVGSLIYEISDNNKTLVCDMYEDGQKFLIARGGRGGKGNTRFKSSTNRAPDKASPGKKGEIKKIRIEMKLLADIGLVGYPSSGKSTFINYVTNSNAKTAEYPFTTLYPNLGNWHLKSNENVLIADIPGIIDGASEGKGLGINFLKHIERTRVLLFIIDPIMDLDFENIPLNAVRIYKNLISELNAFNQKLIKKPRIIVINKIDITEIKEKVAKIRDNFNKLNENVVFISSITGEGIEDLENILIGILRKHKKVLDFNKDVIVTKVYSIDTIPNRRVVKRNKDSSIEKP